MLACLLLTCCCAAWFLTGQGLVLVYGLGVRDPCSSLHLAPPLQGLPPVKWRPFCLLFIFLYNLFEPDPFELCRFGIVPFNGCRKGPFLHQPLRDSCTHMKSLESCPQTCFLKHPPEFLPSAPSEDTSQLKTQLGLLASLGLCLPGHL